MFLYAQIENNLVVGISELSGKVENENLVDITNLEVKPNLGYIHNPITGEFTEPETKPAIPQPRIEEQILAEIQYQTALLEVTTLGGSI